MKSTDPQTPPSTTAWYSVSALDLATHLGILTIATLLVAPGMLKRGEVGGIGTTICVVGAAGTAVLAVLAYRFAVFLITLYWT